MTTLTLQNDVLVIDKETETVKPELLEPSLYNVIFIDDDTTSMQFVCDGLELFFNKSPDDAYEHMMKIHITGSSNLGTYTKDIAESKIDQILNLGKSEGFAPTIKLLKN